MIAPRRWLPSLLVLLVACAGPPEQELLDGALERRGNSGRVRADGAVRSAHGELRGLPFESETAFRPPNLLRYRLTFPLVGETLTQLFDGARGYALTGGRGQSLSPVDNRVLRNRALDEAVFWLVTVADTPSLTIGHEGTGTFRGRAVETLRVEHWSGYLRHLHFDPATRDLVGSEGYTWTEFGRVYLESVYSEFVEADGVRVPSHVEEFADGAPFRTYRQTVRCTGVPPPAAFEVRPEDSAPPE